MLTWCEEMVLEILKKYGRAMTEIDIMNRISDEMGRVNVRNALLNLEELNMIHVVNNTEWRA